MTPSWGAVNTSEDGAAILRDLSRLTGATSVFELLDKSHTRDRITPSVQAGSDQLRNSLHKRSWRSPWAN